MSRYTIDPGRTTVWIEARSSLHPIHSESRGMEGYFDGEVGADGLLDLSSPLGAHLELSIAKMSSGNGLYDREMMRRVEARHFPVITAELRQLTAAEAMGSYVAEGDITFRGVTQRVRDEVTFSRPEVGTVVFEGKHVFSLRDFKMEPPKIMMLRVYPDVTVRVRIVARAEG
ncbi:MAG TPA: YceI family protein [Acidimicrobiales bacterium]|nr:YceI family protein [Acidimicrobiales bacterium]